MTAADDPSVDDERYPTFDPYLAKIEKRQRAAARRAWLALVPPLAIGLAIVIYSATQARAAMKARTDAERARSAADSSRQAINRLLSELSAARDTLTKARDALEAGRTGINLFHAGRYADAIASYDAALRSDPSNAYILNLKGYAFFKAGRLDDAIAALQRSVTADPGYGYGHFDLARVYCAKREYENALVAARAALKHRPDLRSYMLGTDGEFVRLCRPILTRISSE